MCEEEKKTRIRDGAESANNIILVGLGGEEKKNKKLLADFLAGYYPFFFRISSLSKYQREQIALAR